MMRDGNSNEIIKIFNHMDVGSEDTPLSPASCATNNQGFGDKSLGVQELRNGLNFLLNTNISSRAAQQVLNLVDSDGSGDVDLREFLDSTNGDTMSKKIEEYEWRKQRHLIKPEKRQLIEARRPFAQKGPASSGRKNFSETSHSRHLQKCYASKTNREAFYRPDQILQQLRERVKIPDMVRTFRNMDVGAVGTANTGDGDGSSCSSNAAQGFNSLLEPKELSEGINKNLNMEILPSEVKKILQVIDTDGDGSINFSEFVQALRGEKVQHYIDSEKANIPNFNVTRREWLKSKSMTNKIGSNSWKKGAVDSSSPRRENTSEGQQQQVS